MRAWLSVLLVAFAVPAGAELRAPAIKGRGSVPIYVGVPTLAQVVCGGVTNGSVCGGSGSGGGISFGGSTGGTNTRIPFTDGTGVLADDADLVFVTDTLTATKLIVPTLGTFGASSGAANSIDISTAGIVFEGLTANASETTLGVVDPTADVTFNLQTATAGTYRLTAQTNAALTSGRVPIATTDGMLADDADLTFATDTLTATKIVGSTSITDTGLTAGRVTIAGVGGLLADDADLTFATDTLTVTKLSVPTIELGSAATDTTITRSAAGVVAVEGVDLASISGAQSITGKTFPSFELGTAATDTTITRSAAGKVAVEGVDLADVSSSQVLTNKQMTTIELGAASDTTIARVGAGIISVEGSRIMTFGTESSGQTVSGAWLWGSNQTVNTDFSWVFGPTARIKYSSSMTPDAMTLQVPTASLSYHIIDNADSFADALNGPCASAACGAPTVILDPKTPTGAQYLGVSYYGTAGFALKTLTESSATTLVNIPVAASAGTGGEFRYCVFASDSTDQQSRCGTVHFAASNKAGTETCAVYGIDTLFTVNPAETQDGSGAGAISSGTLTYAWTSSNSPTNACAFSLNAVSSLTQTTLVARYRVDMTGPGEPAPQ